MTSNKFMEDYVKYHKIHEENRLSTSQRNAFWRQYMRDYKNENK